jgi:4'-phosphopantetheinyl transferase
VTRVGPEAGAVVVRWARIDEVPVDAAGLSDGERSRLDALRHDDDRRRFVGVRLLLRHVLGPGAGTLHQSCPRCGGPHGRPTIRGGPAVSLAHAGDIAVVAVARRRSVGVDVEPGDDRRWVRTEAVLKATGHGFEVDPSLVEVGPHGVVAWAGPGRRPRLRLVDLAVGDGYVAAVAGLGRRSLRVDAAAVTLPR